MNKKKIEEIVEMMDKYGLTEIDVEEEGVRIHLKKGVAGGLPAIIPHALAQQISAATKMEEAAPATKQEARNLIEVKAPMVGTFYTAPAPDAPSYVQIGDVVNEGDVLCIIEAMKLMNEIKSEARGKIADILVDSGQPIEFGQVLFRIEPS